MRLNPRFVVGLAVGYSVLVSGLLAGCGGTRDKTLGAERVTVDAAYTTLGAYDFGPNSNVLTHPCFSIGVGSPKWVSKGYGSEVGKTVTATYSDGGLVKNVKTVKMTVKFSDSLSPMYFWLAQDKAGNIHYLRAQDGPYPARYTGVAAGQKPWFWLPRPSDTVKGRTWYEYRNGVRIRQNKIISLSASCRGKSGLLQLRDIRDENSDKAFDPSWGGPDNRHDVYFNPVTHRPWAVVTNATGDYAG